MTGLLGAQHRPVRRVAVRRGRPLVRTVLAIQREVRARGTQREARDRLVHQEAMLLARLAGRDPRNAHDATAAVGAGSRISITAPGSPGFATRIVPPCSSTASLQNARPRPVPPRLRP